MGKPILFNTEMVQAILEGRKTSTRRVIKGIPCGYTELQGIVTSTTGNDSLIGSYMFGHGCMCEYRKPPYQVGDILWVRETWEIDGQTTSYNNDGTILYQETYYKYKADKWGNTGPWRPSIHMPKTVARIFLKVTDVKVQRLQNMTSEDCLKEGVKLSCKHDNYICSAHPCEFKNTNACKDHFIDVWYSTIKKQDLNRYGWNANPWVWVIEFERLEG